MILKTKDKKTSTEVDLREKKVVYSYGGVY